LNCLFKILERSFNVTIIFFSYYLGKSYYSHYLTVFNFEGYLDNYSII